MADAPSVTSVQPRSGRAEGSDVVIIKGTGFNGATAVFFGKQSAVPFKVNSDTEITTFSPPGTDTVDVTVKTPNGTSASNSAAKFTYRGPEHNYYAALVATAPLMAFVPAAVTVAVYSFTGPTAPGEPQGSLGYQSVSIYIGILSGLAVWFLLSFLYHRIGFTAADGANMRSYNDLCEGLRKLNVQLNGSCLEQEIKPHQFAFGQECIRREKCPSREACSWRDGAESQLSKGGLQWVLGTGYVNMYSLLHRAEEALIESESDDAVIGGALYDELRLQGSEIRNSARLLTKLRRAVRMLNPQAASFLNEQPPISEELQSGEQLRSDGGAASTTTGSMPTSYSNQEEGARASLRVVRRTINEYRDDQRDGLVRARNHLMWVIALFGFATYLVLVLTVIWGAYRYEILAATAFYLVGATVGLFSRLHSESATHTDVDDFGLSVARLLATPLLSGAAAVIGVFVTAVLITAGLVGPFLGAPAGAPGSTPAAPTATSIALATAPAPVATASSGTPSSSPTGTSQSATPTSSQPSPTLTSGATTALNENKVTPDLPSVLSTTYDLRLNPGGLIYAAIFGLAPNLLIGTLQQQAAKYKEQLKSSGPSDQGGNE